MAMDVDDALAALASDQGRRGLADDPGFAARLTTRSSDHGFRDLLLTAALAGTAGFLVTSLPDLDKGRSTPSIAPLTAAAADLPTLGRSGR